MAHSPPFDLKILHNPRYPASKPAERIIHSLAFCLSKKERKKEKNHTRSLQKPYSKHSYPFDPEVSKKRSD